MFVHSLSMLAPAGGGDGATEAVAYARIFSLRFSHFRFAFFACNRTEPDTRCRRRRRQQQRRPSSPHHQGTLFLFLGTRPCGVVENIQIHSGADDKRDFLC